MIHIRGIKTEMCEGVETNNSNPELEKIVKTLANANDKYLPVSQMKPNPVRKDTQEGKENLIRALTDSGKHDETRKKQYINYHRHIVSRMK